jgi:hypothetical protein
MHRVTANAVADRPAAAALEYDIADVRPVFGKEAE